MELLQIPRVQSSDFRPPRLGGIPRVIVGLARGWEAIEKWQPHYLKSLIGDYLVPVSEVNGPPRNIYQNQTRGGRVAFSQYLDWVLETSEARDLKDIVARFDKVSDVIREVSKIQFEASYYLAIELKKLSKKLFQDVEIPDWYKAKPIDVNFWCGLLGTSSGLHYDISPNCNVQIKGNKHFILFSPTQSKLLYPISGVTTHCSFDPNLPDYNRFPLARKALGWECRLQPGESIYIPAGWYHQVTITSSWALNVNFAWSRPFPQGLATPFLWRMLLFRSFAKLYVKLFRNHKLGGMAK